MESTTAGVTRIAESPYVVKAKAWRELAGGVRPRAAGRARDGTRRRDGHTSAPAPASACSATVALGGVHRDARTTWDGFYEVADLTPSGAKSFRRRLRPA